MNVHPLTVPAGVVSVGLLAAAGLMSLRVTAGPLDPPAGAVGSTYKTLSEVEPRIAINQANTPGDADSVFKITVPGSYVMTGNMKGEPGKHGIEVTTGGVTIDLMGFEVIGVPGSLSGVAVTAVGLRDITVRHGVVSGWAGLGASFLAFPVSAGRIEGVAFRNNTGGGIQCGDGFIVSECAAVDNGGNGFFAASGCVLVNCTARANTGFGISSSNGGTITGCTASSNGSIGIRTDSGAIIAGCSAFSNGFIGISGGTHSTISDCSVSSNISDGITISLGGVVDRCSAISNGSNGVLAAGSNTISGCSITGNEGNGVQAASDCVVRGNICDSNGDGVSGAGILIVGSDSAVEDNNCTDNFRGIEATLTGNFITRNVCSGNTTNWVVAAGNKCLVVNGVNAGAINGNSGGVSPGSTDPNANYTY